MPYRLSGRTIYHFKGGRWKVKQTATSIPKAQSTMRLLYGFEYGWKPKKGLAAASQSTRYRVAQKGGRSRRR